MVYILLKEAGTRNRSHSDIFDHPFTEFQIRIPRKLRQIQKLLNINQDKIRSLRNIVFQPDPIQTIQEIGTFLCIGLQKLRIITLREIQTYRSGFL